MKNYGPGTTMCNSDGMCPTIFLRGNRVVIKGYKMSEQKDDFGGLGENEELVFIPVELLKKVINEGIEG